MAWADIGPPHSGFRNCRGPFVFVVGRRCVHGGMFCVMPLFGNVRPRRRSGENAFPNQNPHACRSPALRRRNATARCQPRPSAWVTAPKMTQNPNGVARFDGDVRWFRRFGSCCLIHRVVRASIIRGDWFLLSVANFGPPRWGYVSWGGVENPGRWPGLTSGHPIRGFGISLGRSCFSRVDVRSTRSFAFVRVCHMSTVAAASFNPTHIVRRFRFREVCTIRGTRPETFSFCDVLPDWRCTS